MVEAEKLLDIGLALTKEKNVDKLLELILDIAMEMMNCDGGTLYMLEDDELWFKIMITISKGIRKVVGETVNLPPVKLSPQNVCSRSVLDKKLINLADVYESDEFNFTGTKKYDELNAYRTQSMLTVPMEDDHGDVIGVLQLINAQDENGKIIPFAAEYDKTLFSVASQAAICLTNRKYAHEVVELLDSFVRAMSAAIDARSPYNANHTRNMAVYGQKFVEWMNSDGAEHFNHDRERQFLMSIWLHDIGKLVVPLEVMDKDSRLGLKLTAVLFRYQAFVMQAEIDFLRNAIDEDEYNRRVSEAERARELVEKSNKAGFLNDETLDELSSLGSKKALGPNGEETYLTPEELTCMLVRRGTLTDEERQIMESHVHMTRRMLSEVRFPKKYRAVPDWASSHHEHLNGKGYPDCLTADDIPVEVRILTILDIYDALTARDRPYKPGMPPEKAFAILGDMAEKGQIDKDFLELYRKSEAWM